MWEQALSSGGSLVGGVMGAIGSRSAAKRQRNAANESNRWLQQGLDQSLSDLSPYRDFGQRGMDQLSMLMGLSGDRNDPNFGRLMRDFRMEDFQADPGYQFRQQEGEAAINRNALARGRFNSGSVLKGLQRFNSGLASQEFGNAFDRWRATNSDMYGRGMGVTQVGQNAVNSGNALRQATTSQIAGNVIGAGNADAAGRMQMWQSLADGFSQGANNWMQGQSAVRRPNQGFGGWQGQRGMYSQGPE